MKMEFQLKTLHIKKTQNRVASNKPEYSTSIYGYSQLYNILSDTMRLFMLFTLSRESEENFVENIESERGKVFIALTHIKMKIPFDPF